VDEGFSRTQDVRRFVHRRLEGDQRIDMILMPGPANRRSSTPFYEETTVNLRCDVIEPMTMQGYERDPARWRSARKPT